MTERIIKKNMKLLWEFNAYAARHRALLSGIPNGATVVMTVAGDEKFNKSSREMAIRATGKRSVIEAYKEGRRWSLRPFVEAR